MLPCHSDRTATSTAPHPHTLLAPPHTSHTPHPSTHHTGTAFSRDYYGTCPHHTPTLPSHHTTASFHPHHTTHLPHAGGFPSEQPLHGRQTTGRTGHLHLCLGPLLSRLSTTATRRLSRRRPIDGKILGTRTEMGQTGTTWPATRAGGKERTTPHFPHTLRTACCRCLPVRICSAFLRQRFLYAVSSIFFAAAPSCDHYRARHTTPFRLPRSPLTFGVIAYAYLPTLRAFRSAGWI